MLCMLKIQTLHDRYTLNFDIYLNCSHFSQLNEDLPEMLEVKFKIFSISQEMYSMLCMLKIQS